MKKSKFILLMLSLMVIYVAFNIVSIWTYGKSSRTVKADVAIVLGAATYNGTVSAVYRERINHAVYLYNEGYVKKLIMTGGFGAGSDTADSYAAKQYAISKNIPAADILTEDASTITQENLENAKRLMDEHGFKTALIVSDPLHMKRAMLLAKDAGILAYSSPTQTSRYVSLKTKIPFVIRETYFYIGYKLYRIFK